MNFRQLIYLSYPPFLAATGRDNVYIKQRLSLEESIEKFISKTHISNPLKKRIAKYLAHVRQEALVEDRGFLKILRDRLEFPGTVMGLKPEFQLVKRTQFYRAIAEYTQRYEDFEYEQERISYQAYLSLMS